MKKFLIIAFVVIFIVLAGAWVYVLQKSRQVKVISPESASKVTPTEAPQELLTWKDPAGFSFQYPKNTEVNKHDEDQDNYAHVEITQKNNPGTIIVWAKDTRSADAAGWVKAEKSLGGGTVFDTSLAGLSGKKVLLTTPKKIIVSAIVDQGVVFYVEGTFDSSDYWTKAYDTITSSFAFTAEDQAAPAGAGGTDDNAVDEEETIQ